MGEIAYSGYREFDGWLALVGRTRELLDDLLAAGELPDGGADFLAERTLPHVEGIQAGFVGWLRSDSAGTAELQHLVRLVASLRVEPPSSEAERRAAATEAELERTLAAAGRPSRRLTSAEPWNLAALAHARLVLALLPQLPDEAVRFPGGRRTYADIPTPRGPAELADRLAELERVLWQAAIGRSGDRVQPALRRTYGFFDVADHLGRRAFGGTA